MGYTMTMDGTNTWTPVEPEWDSARLIESIMAAQEAGVPVRGMHDGAEQGPGSGQFILFCQEMALAGALEGLFEHGDGCDEEAPGHDC